MQRLCVAALIAAAFIFIGSSQSAFADTQVFQGVLTGKTYRNNPTSSCSGFPWYCYQGVWGETAASWYPAHDLRIQLNPQAWTSVSCSEGVCLYTWASIPGHDAHAVTTSISRNRYNAGYYHRGWSYHKDNNNGVYGTTSDGYCGDGSPDC